MTCQGRHCWPCAHPLPCPCAQTLCPTSPLSSAGHRAASWSSSHDLWRIIHSLRCSWGWLLPPSWPFSPPSLSASPSINLRILLDCTMQRMAERAILLCRGDYFPFHWKVWKEVVWLIKPNRPARTTQGLLPDAAPEGNRPCWARGLVLEFYQFDHYSLAVVHGSWVLFQRYKGFHRAQ